MIAITLLAFVAPVLPQTSQSTELAVRPGTTRAFGPLGLTSVNEASQGGQDINGDGDVFDDLPFKISLDSGLTTYLGIGGYAIGGNDRIAFIEDWEGWHGIDLNADGDQLDYFYQVIDVRSQNTATLSDAVAHGFYQTLSVDGIHAAWLVSEQDDGGIDFNQDGDSDDLVPFFTDARLSGPYVLPLAASSVTVRGSTLAVIVPEAWQSQDLDGDGTLSDSVLFLVNLETGQFENTHLPVINFTGSGSVGEGPRMERGYLLIEVVEDENGGAGQDLNGDGDLLDVVPVLWSAAMHQAISTGFAVEPLRRAELDASAIWVPVSEFAQGAQDLNGDGDVNDQVMHRIALPSFAVQNLSLAVFPGLVGRPKHGRYVFAVDEFAQGTDLNGDGDILDLVAHVASSTSGVVVNLGHSGLFTGYGPINLQRGIAHLISESGDGVDYNSDGDTGDGIACFWDATTGVQTNLFLAAHLPSPFAQEGERRLWLEVKEQEQGGFDYNGDGDSADTTVFLFDPQTLQSFPVGLASHLVGESGRYALLEVDEAGQGDTDFNADGDALDTVVFRLGPLF